MEQKDQAPDYMDRIGKIHYFIWKMLKAQEPDAVLVFDDGDYCFCFMQDAFVLHLLTQLSLRQNVYVRYACAFAAYRREWAMQQIQNAGFNVMHGTQVKI